MCVKIFVRLENLTQGAQMTHISVPKKQLRSLNFDNFRCPLIKSLSKGFCCKKLLMSDTSPFWH
ncbi:MAG: hypothetical protein HUN05_03395 [Desulfobacter sp.]|nr:MAG: hypothetical protein HUN05_03395 [Desulfobacter sp.]